MGPTRRGGGAATIVTMVMLAGDAVPAEIGLQPVPWLEVEDHRIAADVVTAAQTPDGFLWFGTPAGLYRHDGVRFRLEREVGGDTGSVHLVAADRDGSLWIATGGGLVEGARGQGLRVTWPSDEPALYRRRAGKLERFSEGLAGAGVWALAQEASGRLWAGTQRGLCALDRGATSFRCLPEGPRSLVSALAVAPDGSLWIGSGEGLFVRKGEAIVPTEIRGTVRALALGADGRVYAGVDDRVHLVAGAQPSAIPVPDQVRALSADAAGVWIGTTAGLLRLENGRVRRFEEKDNTAFDVTSLFRDREGSLWLGRRGAALAQVRTRRLRNVDEGGRAEAVFAVLGARDGSVWFTHPSGVSRWRDGAIERFKASEPDFPAWAPRTLAEGTDGTIWMSSAEFGLFRLGDGAPRRHRPRTPAGSHDVRTVFVAADGALWIGWREGGASRYAGGKPEGPARHFTTHDGLCPGVVRFIAGARDVVWLATEEDSGRGRLGYVRGDRLRCLDVIAGVPAGDILALAVDPDETVWASLHPHGLLRLRGNEARIIPARAFPARYLLSFLDDGAGRIWISSTTGVFHVERRLLEGYQPGTPLATTLYRLSDGMRSEHAMSGFQPTATLAKDGRIWVPTLLGATVFERPDRLPRPLADPVIDELRAGARRLDPDEPLRLGPGRVDLSVEVAVPSFLAPGSLRLQHVMEGLDVGWQGRGRGGNDHSFTYAQLPPGKYRLRLRTIDEQGRPAGREVLRDVTVEPQLWQRGWFIGLCVLFTVGGVLGVHRLRVRRERARWLAISGERARIARDLHDDIAQGFASLGFHLGALQLKLEQTQRENAAVQLGGLRDLITRAKSVLTRFRDDARRTVWDLRGQSQEALPVVEALRRVVSELDMGARLRLQVSGRKLEASETSMKLNRELSSLVKEAVANAVEHGGATQIDITVAADAQGLQVRIDDDGVGLGAIDLEQPEPGHFGLLGMRERAARLGGTIEFVTHRPGGAGVHLFIPRAALREGA